ncbi:quinol:cytochrome C oxidoreductase [Bacteroidota bacterium]
MENLNIKFQFSKKVKIVLAILILIGLATLAFGLLNYSPEKIWSVLLLNSVNFLTIGLGATFFIAIHIITQSGWHVSIQRIPEAISMYLPIGAIFMIIMLFGLNHVFHWTHEIHHDPLIMKKEAFLNVPFFITRLVIYLSVWIFLTYMLRKLSKKSDVEDGLKFYNKSRTYAALFLVFFAITIVTFAWDWLMSIEAHWFSTLFGWYVLSGVIVKSFAAIIIVVAILRYLGYLEFITTENIHDLARYLFSFGIFWMYLWFSQFMLIWYANIPEETFYYIKRIDDYRFLFFLNLTLNFLIPFLVLVIRKFRRELWIVTAMAIVVFIGQWVDQYLMIFPDTMKEIQSIGLFDIGLTIGFIGIFLWVVLLSLTKADLLPKNHPYLEESFHYENI